MTQQDDLSYYVRRERDERRLADKAAENCVRKVHTRLADEYARRVRSAIGGAREPDPEPVAPNRQRTHA